MEYTVTIDGAGRLVIPKPLRERLRLRPGTALRLGEAEGSLVLRPDVPEARLVERDGFLVLDLTGEQVRDADHREARQERLAFNP